jgi:hypothetical protein
MRTVALSPSNIEILASEESALGVGSYTESSLFSEALRGVFRLFFGRG